MSLTRTGVYLENPPFSAGYPTDGGSTQRDALPLGSIGTLAFLNVPPYPVGHYAPRELPILPSVGRPDDEIGHLLAQSEYKLWLGPFRCLKRRTLVNGEGMNTNLPAESRWLGLYGFGYQKFQSEIEGDPHLFKTKTIKQKQTIHRPGETEIVTEATFTLKRELYKTTFPGVGTVWQVREVRSGDSDLPRDFVPSQTTVTNEEEIRTIRHVFGNESGPEPDYYLYVQTEELSDPFSLGDLDEALAEFDSDDVFANYPNTNNQSSRKTDVSDSSQGFVSVFRYRIRNTGYGRKIRVRWREVERVIDSAAGYAPGENPDLGGRIEYPIMDEYGFHDRGRPRFDLLRWRLLMSASGTKNFFSFYLIEQKIPTPPQDSFDVYYLGQIEATLLRFYVPHREQGKSYSIQMTIVKYHSGSTTSSLITREVDSSGYTTSDTYDRAWLGFSDYSYGYLGQVQILENGVPSEDVAWRAEFKQRYRRSIIGFRHSNEPVMGARYATRTITYTKPDHDDKTSTDEFDTETGMLMDRTGWDGLDELVEESEILEEEVDVDGTGESRLVRCEVDGHYIRLELERVEYVCTGSGP